MGLNDQRAKVVRSTFLFADFKGFTERVRILEKTAGHQAAAEMKRKVAQYVDDAFRELEAGIKPADYQLIDTAGDGFFFHFRRPMDVFRFAETLQKITATHNANVTDDIAEHWFRTGAATGDVAWDAGKPVGHVVNVGSRLQSASTGGDLVIDQATFDALLPEMQRQFGPKEVIRDKHDKTYDVYRTAFGRTLSALPISNVSNIETPVPQATSSDANFIKIVPKGLRSFDAGDADFYLELLPGPRDREGLPDRIRFWKARLETTDADSTFPVGLIYGPSGCGKSSLVKAGLLPRLAKSVIVVYIEATADETESRLLKGLRRQVPELPSDFGLIEAVAAMRQGRFLKSGRKMLLVLDQFEQWLHARRNEDNAELVQALRQCDGGRVQCVVMVRDDFWLVVSRFMKAMEIEILEGRNSALVDLFDAIHARKVLAAFGRAYGRLPDNLGQCSKEQDAFLDHAVAGLAQEGRVISVRLALFAEMVKGKQWTPATLKDVGGTEGVGVTFLEETFSSATAPAGHRFHQQAITSVLKSLLPEAWTDIKGHMRSYQDLLNASGYAGRPKDFDDVLRILDGELRLITPTDIKGVNEELEASKDVPVGEKYYQLTHDYLVPSIREWLIRTQRESRQGRAELRLSMWSSVWNGKPENRNLPSWWEWVSIRLLTKKKTWTKPQQKMMRKARRHHVVRGLILAVILALVGWGADEGHGTLQAHSLRDRLLDANTADVPAIVADMAPYHRWIDKLLREAHKEVEANEDPRKQLHTSLALLPVDASQVPYLYGRLLGADAHEVPVICDALSPHQGTLVEKLWTVALTPEKGKDAQRLRAASALAKYDPHNEKWTKCGPLVANDLVQENPYYLGQWSESFRPVKQWLLSPLSAIFRDRDTERAAERTLATNLLADYAGDQPRVLAALLMDADEKQFARLYPLVETRSAQCVSELVVEIDKQLANVKDDDKEKLAKRQANAAVALLKMKQPAKVWPLLKHSPDPRVRSYLIHRLSPLGAEAEVIINRLDIEPDITIRRALMLALGDYNEEELTLDTRKTLLTKLQKTYQTDSDPGLHASAEWLLRTWKHEAWLKQVNEEWAKDKERREKRLEGIQRILVKDKEKTPPQWYVTSQGQTMVVLPGPVEVMMGSPPTEAGRQDFEHQHKRRIARTFAIAAKSVTMEQFMTMGKKYFNKDSEPMAKRYAPENDCPALFINWYLAAEYCNWLSAMEGIDKSQWCYETASGRVTGLKAGYLGLAGYRLPTEAEMEYAARAGALTSRYFGETDELLPKYAWYQKNAAERSWPVGRLKPNDFGLFDVQGNVATWCQDSHQPYPQGKQVYEDKEDADLFVSASKLNRVLRGGTFANPASMLRSTSRNYTTPSTRNHNFGFRLARTLQVGSLTAILPAPQ